MTRYMYDAVNPDNIPADAQMVAGYVDGPVSVWPEAAWSKWPGAQMIRITVTGASLDADVVDVETGDVTPAGAVEWIVAKRARGEDGVVYCNVSTLFAVRNAFGVRKVRQPMYWLARPGADESIPGDCVAVQFDFHGGYDRSAVRNYWPGIGPAPSPVPVIPPPPPGFTEGSDNVTNNTGQVQMIGSRGFFTLPDPTLIGRVVSVNVFEQTPSIVGNYVPVPGYVGLSSDKGTLEFGPGAYGPVSDAVYGFEYWVAG